ncbi:hypothetical protein [Agrobacterium sp.]|uniref:hypothetical protein n=1 Tax=Agrobacterium sp. TaxID=361 RepID=UPI0028B0E0AB|nr:hypothetical protein [Agrobacterium sp.]
MTFVFTRIFLRYLAAILVTKGLIAPDMGHILSSDPDLATALHLLAGTLAALAAEGWYYLAHRFGWAK